MGFITGCRVLGATRNGKPGGEATVAWFIDGSCIDGSGGGADMIAHALVTSVTQQQQSDESGSRVNTNTHSTIHDES